MILIFCAFTAELNPLRARLRDARAIKGAGWNGYAGSLGETAVVLVTTGIGVKRSRQRIPRVFEQLPGLGLPAIDSVIMAGVAGALRPGLPVGAIILANQVMMASESAPPAATFAIAPALLRRCGDALSRNQIGFVEGGIITSSTALATPALKRLAGERSGAIAVDMESAVVAEAAAARGLPFICVRAILDAVDDELAGARLANEDGTIRAWPAARALLTHPSLIAGVVRLLRNLRVAAGVMAIATTTIVADASRNA